jgi:hypothetical protein
MRDASWKPAKAVGVKRIDFMVVTHYDGDHVGNVPALVERMPVVTFVEHGENVHKNERTIKNVDVYMALVAKAKHIVVKPEDNIPIKGFDAFVAMSAGQAIAKPLKGAGQPNLACDTTPCETWGPDARGLVDNHDTNENAMSLGPLVTYRPRWRVTSRCTICSPVERKPMSRRTTSSI